MKGNEMKLLKIIRGVIRHLYWRATGAVERALFIGTTCSWCNHILRRPLDRRSTRVSHTICPGCVVKLGLPNTLLRPTSSR